jgi:RNA polymerase sigma-70 factor (ECF subfamily)
MPGPDPPELSNLMERVRSGDEAALAELLQRYEPRLRTAARVLLGPWLRPHLDSLDLVQSVNCVLLPGLRQGKYDVSSPEKLLGLALTIVRRKVANKWRHLQRQTPSDALKEEDGAGGDLLLVSQNADDDPAANALVNDTLEHVLGQLDGPDRQLIELRLLGYSTVEIARHLDCDPHLLRARLSRLRQRLRDQGVADCF